MLIGASTQQGVYLVNENDAWFQFSGQLEKAVNKLFTFPDILQKSTCEPSQVPVTFASPPCHVCLMV